LSRQVEIRRAESDGDFAGYAKVWNAITPREPITVAETRRRLEVQPWQGNEPMRAIKEKLGYRERPAWILVCREAV
jgi:hypothetical protein